MSSFKKDHVTVKGHRKAEGHHKQNTGDTTAGKRLNKGKLKETAEMENIIKHKNLVPNNFSDMTVM